MYFSLIRRSNYSPVSNSAFSSEDDRELGGSDLSELDGSCSGCDPRGEKPLLEPGIWAISDIGGGGGKCLLKCEGRGATKVGSWPVMSIGCPQFDFRIRAVDLEDVLRFDEPKDKWLH
jgi:hypothetical protein